MLLAHVALSGLDLTRVGAQALGWDRWTSDSGRGCALGSREIPVGVRVWTHHHLLLLFPFLQVGKMT